jgi:hypothetical protein
VRVEADVVVPLHFLAAVGPLEVELGVVELHVRAHQVCDDVRHHRIAAIVPEDRVLLHRIRDAAQARRVGPVRGLEIEDRIGLGHLAAALDELIGRGAQLRDPLLADRLGHEKEPVVEVRLTLLLGQDLRLDGENLFRCHGNAPS